jgi:dimethylamine monooxygenase subunit A
MNDTLSRFPFPLKKGTYDYYANNSIPLQPPYSIEVTPEYQHEIHLKRRLLNEAHSRCYQSLSHTEEAQWEVVELVLYHLTAAYPKEFLLHKEKNCWTLINQLTGEEERFVFGDAASLPFEPLDFVGRHVQEDLILMMQRDEELYLEAGQLCFPGNWSLVFKLGMTFHEIHEPIPGFFDRGAADKIRTFLLHMEAGRPWVRNNWSLTAGNHLDTFPETYHEWGIHRHRVTVDNAGSLIHLRVEVQKLFRLPRTQGILFTIHTHMLPLEQLARQREWLHRFTQVVTQLPDEIAEYKGITPYKQPLFAYLHKQSGGGERGKG